VLNLDVREHDVTAITAPNVPMPLTMIVNNSIA